MNFSSICVSELVKILEDRCAALIEERNALEAELSAMEKTFGVKRGSQEPAPEHPSARACRAQEKKERKRRKKQAAFEDMLQREAKRYEEDDNSV